MSSKRKFKRLVNPLYGKKGMGWIKNPKRAFKGKLRRETKKAANDAMGCLWACIWYPIYWSCVLMYWMVYYIFALMWLMLKYMFVGLWWLGVKIINALISLAEWLINLNREDEPHGTGAVDAIIEEQTKDI